MSKVHDSIDKLRIHLKVNDPCKLINVLIVKQQLNIIEPVITPVALSRRSADILKLPKFANKTIRPRKGLYVSFGIIIKVVVEIIKEMENRKIDRKIDDQKDAEDPEADVLTRAEHEKRATVLEN